MTRGIVGKTLTPEIVEAIDTPSAPKQSRASSTLSPSVATDDFPDQISHKRWLAASRKAGINVIDVGMVATPMTYSPLSSSRRIAP